MKTLVINTYGGSLLLGARSVNAEIIGSYEDDGWGSDIQAANFPDVDLRRTRREWPTQDLSDVVVIAHPPCSAFSVQNTSPTARGVNSNAFACTKVVLDYATENNALAICIESVTRAMAGAWQVHQEYADRCGYHLYRVLQQGALFGTGQWRERFWAIYIKKGAAHPNLELQLRPRFNTVADVITGYEASPAPHNIDILLEELKKKLRDEIQVRDEDMSFFFDPQDPPHRTQGFARLFTKRLFTPGEDVGFISHELLDITFSSGQLCYIDPRGLAGVILGSSWYYVNGRNLSEAGYKRLMGFPADYVFPDGPLRRNMRTYLSKGVIPNVAGWVLRNVKEHLEGRRGAAHGDWLCKDSGCPAGYHVQPYVVTVEPNRIADLRISLTAKRRWGQERPLLREQADDGDDEQEATA